MTEESLRFTSNRKGGGGGTHPPPVRKFTLCSPQWIFPFRPLAAKIGPELKPILLFHTLNCIDALHPTLLKW